LIAFAVLHAVLGVRDFHQLHRWAARQCELYGENRRLRDQTKAFTELAAAYEHQIQVCARVCACACWGFDCLM
jgi:hypothetical protein